MSKNKDTTSPQSLDSVDQIRNILFGEQISLIEQRFSKLEEELTLAISKLSDKVDENTKQLQSETSSLAQEQSEDLKKLQDNINSKIIETESELLNQIQKGLEQLDHKASHRNDLAQLLNEMAQKLAD